MPGIRSLFILALDLDQAKIFKALPNPYTMGALVQKTVSGTHMASRNLFLLCLAISLFALTVSAEETADTRTHVRTPHYSEEGAESCLRCHAGGEMRAIQDGPHFNLQNPGAPAAHHYCESCHGPGSIHISRAHGGRGFPPLIEFGRGKDKSPRDTQIAACSYCHDGANGSKPVVFEGTVHDRLMINCSSCHQAHVREDPVMVRGSQAGVCLTCHKKQANEHPQVGKRVPDFDRMGCAGCHRVHRLPENQEGGG